MVQQKTWPRENRKEGVVEQPRRCVTNVTTIYGNRRLFWSRVPKDTTLGTVPSQVQSISTIRLQRNPFR